MKHVLTLLAFALMSSGVAQVPDYIPTDGLMAWYPMNGNALDESGNGFNCQSVGATLTEDRFGIPSSAYTFDGQGSHLQGTSLPFSDLSISIWFKPDAGILESYGGGNPPTGAQLIGQGTTHSPCRYCDWAIGVSDWYDGTDQLAWEKANVSSCQVQQSAATWNPEIGVWTHLMAVSEGSNVTFYINGSWVSTIPFEEPLQHGGSVFSIGARYVENCNGGGSCTGPDNAWSGAIDDVAIWNRALTPEEVESVHSSEPTLVGCTDTGACNYEPTATQDDGSCDYSCCPGPGCCGVGMHWDWELGMCQITNVADTNLDGCVQLNDLLDVLSAYGNCAEPVLAENPCGGGAFLPGDDIACAGWNYLGSYDGGEYYLSSIPLAWDSAQAFASELNGGLAVISSQEENDWISNLVGDNYVWIGLYQDLNSTFYSEPDGGWGWVNGAPFVYENWASNSPNNVNNGTEHHCQMYSNGLWNDAPGYLFINGSDGRDIYAVIEFR